MIYCFLLQSLQTLSVLRSVIACIDSPYIKKIVKNIKRPITTYGMSKDAIRASNLKFNENKSSYELLFNNTSFGQISLKV